jgi:hypothetical protein
MKKWIVFLFLSFFSWVNHTQASSFKEIDNIFSSLQTDYDGKADFKELSLLAGQTLSQFDSALRLYHSDSKAFLYENNHLIGLFELPKNGDSLQWSTFLADILQTGSTHSSKILLKEKDIERAILQKITNQLDEYSRTEGLDAFQSDIVSYTESNVLYVRLKSFSDNSAKKVQEIISHSVPVKGMVLDLRGNHGGKVDEAIKTAGMFLDNTLIAYSQDKDKNRHYYTSAKGDILKDKPLVLLINEETASSAEIVAAALAEQSRATIIGTKSYGKNSIQRQYALEDQNLFITTAHFYTPSGRYIEKEGILPQICTGINKSCLISDRQQVNKDITMAIDFINLQYKARTM